ncbi:hypothetical protein [Streptomyces sp. NPDC048665]|uniref:amino acid kinase family protein n=1 Tax=Streptomyces sp. NPDC048665 TaxID=3155490 RepID=UPI003412EBCA
MRALVAALPEIGRLYGAVVVVVAGPCVLEPGPLGEAFAEDLALLRYHGARPVVVHDAGAEPVAPYPGEDRVTALRRVTAGLVQPRLVGRVNAHGPLAVGITGEDGGTLTRTASGDLVADTGVLRVLLADGRIPVVAALTAGPGGVRPADPEATARLLATELAARLLLLPATVQDPAPAGATPLDTAVPHALLRTVYGLDGHPGGLPGPRQTAASPTAGPVP